MFWRGRIHVEAIALDRHLHGLIAESAKFSVQIIADRGFVAADGLDVHELPRQSYSVHGGENSREQTDLRPQDFLIAADFFSSTFTV